MRVHGIVLYEANSYLSKLIINNFYSSKIAYKHSAIIFDENDKIIADGFNYQAPYFKTTQSIHAEVCAINKIKYNKFHKSRIHNYKIYVFRMTHLHCKSDDIIEIKCGNSRPCMNCYNEIIKVGFKPKNIYYSLSLDI